MHKNLALHTPSPSPSATTNPSPCCDADADGKGAIAKQCAEVGQPNNRFTHRGIFAKHGPISKGEVLLRLPRHLALDGSLLPATYDYDVSTHPDDDDDATCTAIGASDGQQTTQQQQRNASPWLRCLSSLIQAWCQSKHCDRKNGNNNNNNSIIGHPKEDIDGAKSKPTNFYNPYLASLPKEYDSLLNWSVVEIQSFLAGTALGTAALQYATTCSTSSESNVDGGGSNNNNTRNDIPEDANERALQERFLKTVVPYLAYLKNKGLLSAESYEHQGQGVDDKSSGDDRNPKRQKTEETNNNGNIGSSHELEHLYPLFREGCMCISTRAFHMQAPPTSASDGSIAPNSNVTSYQGPYLLPYIDLLNHAPKGTSKHVTTLRRDADGSFVMVAERNIAIDEEVCHSYDSGAAKPDDGGSNGEEQSTSSLNSAQLLQTFGFVDVDAKSERLRNYFQWNATERQISRNGAADLVNSTPAVLTKEQLSDACKQVAKSTYPNTLELAMERSGMLDEGWESWRMPKLDDGSKSMRWELIKAFSEELIIPFRAALSDEMISICCLHFLPEDALNELAEEGSDGDGQSQSLLLGSEVLEDYFLDKLVLRAIATALDMKAGTYQVNSGRLLKQHTDKEKTRQCLDSLRTIYWSEKSFGPHIGTTFDWGRNAITDAPVLSKLEAVEAGTADLLQKFKYGMVISLEERACLSEFRKQIMDKMDALDGDDNC